MTRNVAWYRRVLALAALALFASLCCAPGAVRAAGPTRDQALVPPVLPFPGAVTFHVYATPEGLVGGTTANGHVIQPHDRFVSLPSRLGLSSKDGHEKQVLITYNGRQATAPVWDVGPWNIKDNYWDPPELRETGKDLPRGWPAAQAQYFDKYMGGISDKGYQVRIPAGIDIADGTFYDDLGMTSNDWVDVTFLWLSPGSATTIQPIPAAVRAPIAPFAATATRRYFAESGHSLSDTFKQYWETNGGLAQFGFPLTEPFQEVSADDGKTYTVQYFERARFEAHPENKPPYNVLLGFLGKSFHGPDPAVSAAPNARFFSETGHNLSGDFRTYWEQQGGLARFGFPITEPFKEKSPTNGQVYTVQYFERARFEAHPENNAPYNVLLGQLGRQLLDLRTVTPPK